MEFNLLDALPHELLYILQIYSGNLQLNNKVYNDFIKDIHAGNIFVFDSYYKDDQISFYDNIENNVYFWSSSNYCSTHSIKLFGIDKKININGKETLHLVAAVNEKVQIINSSLLYVRYLASGWFNVSEILTLKMTPDRQYELSYYTTDMVSVHESFINKKITSPDWKAVWNLIPLQDKNGILFQNGYSLIIID
jgi:hypothetical protein